MSGALAPGTRLIETELADRLHLSRTPIRAALDRLLREGYVASRGTGRRSRLIVAPLTREDAAELLQVMAMLEGLAGCMAATLPAEERGRLVGELRALNADMRRVGESAQPDGDRYFELDRAFHRRYGEAAGRPRIMAMLNAIRPQAERYIRVYTSTFTDGIRRSVVEHEAIIDAIEAGQGDAAERAVRRNFVRPGVDLDELIEKSGEWGSW
jgi:DNA-binding GntR family transcriptional regulator